ncbi:MAG: DUF547 domain-containing protein, partial [Candidatus Binatia bacterium]
MRADGLGRAARGAGGMLWLVLLVAAPGARGAGVDQRPWDAILKRYVDAGGRVAYRALRENATGSLKEYLAVLATTTLDGLSAKERLAFWINAYNAVVVAGVLDGYRAENALQRYGFFKLYKRVVAGEPRSPDDIEHGIIRKRFHDPRVHFALVCASSSCPRLRREAYTGTLLDRQLDEQARQFLNDLTRNRIDPVAGTVELSPIFDWFKADFTADGKTVADFAAPYLAPEQTRLL